MSHYSTRAISPKLILEIKEALQNVKGWGSVEIFIQDSEVVQITERSIKKTNGFAHRKITN
ncbi:hypothetical protein A2773_05085 [Candidatus Gottesmanbacteria bacterium RIFCSPHIGHO2_01_FULL_39_10]|uniref:DUF2292 domain-containing protein n=2 Tax=Microgenomates group TaxID=1794810 RepID=A0A1F7H3B7_9BACT|nr:MAG: hypothetical protein A2773_05085 [Candidatus Gottesmanbacteria bacterium RIFCSPHIGHO2_01_FULL_39_10]OGK25414.1 MAG: hypothetical protein A3C28_05280 [Candidatus Roizmanbacteria bacterium RIFCSPHIGHO2_02_FULL_39_9]